MRTKLHFGLAVLAGLAALAAPGCGADSPPPRLESLVLEDVRRPDVVPTYLVICPEKAVETVMPLARWRSAHGQTVRIAAAEKVYAAYGAGRSGPESIRAFVRSLREADPAGTQVRFLLLVGTGDSRNPAGLFLPTWITPAQFYTDKMPSDAFLAGDSPYALLAGSVGPGIAVGRLPARSLQQLRTMVKKTLTFERNNRPGQWRRSADSFAGQGGYGRIIDGFLERIFAAVLASDVPDYFNVHLSYANPSSAFCYAPERFSEHVVRRLNAGPALMVYIGHGSPRGFDHFWWKHRRHDILDSSAIPSIRIPDNRTVMVAVACSTGHFDGPEPCIGERLVACPTGPALFIGSSRISQPYANAVLGTFLNEALLNNPPATVGEAILKVQQWLASGRRTGFRAMLDIAAATQLGFSALARQRADQVVLYNILGDPALSLGIVRDQATLRAPKEATAGQTVEVRVAGPVRTGTAHFSLTIHRDRALAPVAAVPEDHPDAEAEMIRMNARANDKVVVSHVAEIRSGRAVWQLRVPQSCPPGPFHINVYAEGREHDAAATRPIQIHPAGRADPPTGQNL